MLGHFAPEEELRIARAFPDLRLIISGHSHTPLQPPLREKSSLIVRTGSFEKIVGRVNLDFEDRTLQKMSTQLIEAKGGPPDPEALRVVEPYRAKVEKQMNAILGEATAAFPRIVLRGNDPGGNGGAILNLIADAYRSATGTQIALVNVGGVRTSLSAGPITHGKIFEILPFENTIVTMKINGAQLKRTLGVNLTAVSGVRATFDLSKPKDKRLVSVSLEDDSPIVDATTYTIAINDFMQAGGDGYAEFANGIDVKDTGLRLRDIMSDYIKAKKKVTPVNDGQIQIVN